MKHHPDYTRVYRCTSHLSAQLLMQVLNEGATTFDLECRQGHYEIGYVGPAKHAVIENAWDGLLGGVGIAR